MSFPTPLIAIDQLAGWVGREDLVIVDCRYDQSDTESGRRAYQAGHLPGALYFHLEEDMSGPVVAHGGRHPLPEPSHFAARLSAAGIGPGVKVVAYDDSGLAAARFWWMLRWLGHDEVAVLDGGYSGWVAAGQPGTTEVVTPTPQQFVPRPRPEMIASMGEVRDRPAAVRLIDARSPQRYAGEPSPMDARPGHIPGAINRFYQDVYREGRFFRSPEELRARFEGLQEEVAAIHSCGAGVSACVNLLAMEVAGIRGGRLYVGSWSDWCSHPANPVEKG